MRRFKDFEIFKIVRKYWSCLYMGHSLSKCKWLCPKILQSVCQNLGCKWKLETSPSEWLFFEKFHLQILSRKILKDKVKLNSKFWHWLSMIVHTKFFFGFFQVYLRNLNSNEYNRHVTSAYVEVTNRLNSYTLHMQMRQTYTYTKKYFW